MTTELYPAFPVVQGCGADKGMTLRDYFAAKAMQGYVHYSAANSKFIFSNNDLAKEAYSIADAMMEARK